MRAIAVIKPDQVELVEAPKPNPGPYQALVQTEAACLCNSTDGKLVAGHFPGVENYPLLLGHESAGRVVALGEKARNFKMGDRVIGGLVFDCGDAQYSSGWGGFCEYTLANDHDAMVADNVADATHGWFEVYEIQRAVYSDISLEAAVLLLLFSVLRSPLFLQFLFLGRLLLLARCILYQDFVSCIIPNLF